MKTDGKVKSGPGAQAGGKGPLAGLQVLELTTRLAGPFCAGLLGEFGADVIKVELPGKGDPFRYMGTMTEAGSTLNFLSENRNKKTITLDVRKPKGAELFMRLAAQSDIVIENFRPGTIERWGIGYDALKAVKDDLILIRISAYGQDGPYKDRPGVARIAYGYSGIAYLCGERDGPPLIPATNPLGDYITGLYGVIAALMAYIAKKDRGIGQYADVSLFESIFRLLDELAPAYSKFGYVRGRDGASSPHSVPSNHYLSKDEKWVVLAATADDMFKRLAIVLGRPDLPEKYPTLESRIAGRKEIDGLVGAWVGSLPRDEVLRRGNEGGVTVGPINNIADIFEDEHFKARRTMVEFDDKRVGKLTLPNVYPRLSETPGELRSLGPDLGEHNEEVYRDRLGLNTDEIAAFREMGII